ncbi:MAG TPA: hypothetical protein VGE11_16550 [Pseudonocardia sp.]
MSEVSRPARSVRSSTALRAGLSLSDLDIDELWTAYFGLGGSMSMKELVALVEGRLVVSDHEHDMVAQALNDYFTAKGQDHPVSYASDLEAAAAEDVEHGVHRER